MILLPSMAGKIAVERLNCRWERVRLPKVGWVRFHMTRDISGRMTEATVSFTLLGWHISIGCKDAESASFVDNGAVGIDRGMSVLLMLSDGASYILPERLDLIERRGLQGAVHCQPLQARFHP